MNNFYGKILGPRRIFIILITLAGFFLLIYYYHLSYNFSLGVITGLLTFIYGFFISTVFSFVEKKYINFKLSMADFSADIQSLYRLALLSKQKKFIKVFSGDLKSLINKTISFHPEDYEFTQKVIDDLFDDLELLKVSDQKNTHIFNRFLNILHHLAYVRERLELFGDRYIVGEMKLLFYSYPVLLSILLLLLSLNNFYLLVFSFLLIFVIIFTSHLILDIDDLSYGNYVISKKNLEQLLNSFEE